MFRRVLGIAIWANHGNHLTRISFSITVPRPSKEKRKIWMASIGKTGTTTATSEPAGISPHFYLVVTVA
jgi:hypothetical protein